MSKKSMVFALLVCAALAEWMWGQDKPSPFGTAPIAATEVEPGPVTTGITNSSPNLALPDSRPVQAPANTFDRGNIATAPAAPPVPVPEPKATTTVSSGRTAASSRDPFPEDVIAVNQADQIWRTAQNRLEELGSGCVADGTQIIDQARDAKLKSVASYAKYYQDTLTYWTKSRDSAGEAELSSRTDSAELQAHVNQLQLELQSVNRRKADLDRTFGENHIDNNEEKAALQDLTRIQANKQEQVEKARAAMDQNKAGHEWVMKRKEYARVRLSETNDLLQSTRTELYLYQQLYNAILYRHSLNCDREIARPMETLSDWRQDLKRLSPGASE
jgi:hypothetical protein